MPQTASGLYVPPGGAPASGYQFATSLGSTPAGQNLAYTVSAGFYEEVLSFSAFFQTSASVGNRSVVYAVKDALGATLVLMPSAGTQPAGKGYYYTFTTSLTSPTVDANSGAIGGPVPPLILQPNWTVTMLISGAASGDQFQTAVMIVNRIPTGVEESPTLSLVPTPIAL